MNGVPLTQIELVNTHRLIPGRYPPVGIFDTIAEPDDLETIIELEGWTNDRISAELGVIRRIPSAEWVVGRPMASVIMAAFCHPDPHGARFNHADLGAWYAARSLETAHAEVIHHRTIELEEIGVLDARLQMREYLADMDAAFHDIRQGDGAEYMTILRHQQRRAAAVRNVPDYIFDFGWHYLAFLSHVFLDCFRRTFSDFMSVQVHAGHPGLC